MKFKKKPVIIEAIRFTRNSIDDLKDFMGKSFGEILTSSDSSAIMEMTVITLEDGYDNRIVHIAIEGDWIIKGVENEFYPCKPDIFEKTYVMV